MGLLGDKNELIDQWQALTSLGKLISGCALAIGYLNVSQLADSIFAFRGFLRTIVDFFVKITEPIHSLLNVVFPFDISRNEFDLIALGVLTVGTMLRSLLRIWLPQREELAAKIRKAEEPGKLKSLLGLGKSVDDLKYMDRIVNRPFRIFSICHILAVVVFFVTLIYSHHQIRVSSGLDIDRRAMFVLWIVWPCFLILLSVLIKHWMNYRKAKEDDANLNNGPEKVRALLGLQGHNNTIGYLENSYRFILVVYVFVLVTAAISEGLFRALP